MTSPAGRKTFSSSTREASRGWEQASFDQRRELILDAALELLHDEGLKAVTMRRVAARLGVGAMTLYTYLPGQPVLHREMVRRGFHMLGDRCCAASTLGTPEGWRGGARAYLHFALDHPNLYKLMFDTPLPERDTDLIRGGFQPLQEVVRQKLAEQGHTGAELERLARARAGQYWMGLHGLAMLAIAGRLGIVGEDVDQLLSDLLPRIAPV